MGILKTVGGALSFAQGSVSYQFDKAAERVRQNPTAGNILKAGANVGLEVVTMATLCVPLSIATSTLWNAREFFDRQGHPHLASGAATAFNTVHNAMIRGGRRVTHVRSKLGF